MSGSGSRLNASDAADPERADADGSSLGMAAIVSDRARPPVRRPRGTRPPGVARAGNRLIGVNAGARHVGDEQLLQRRDLAGQPVDLAVDDQDADRAHERDQEREHLQHGGEGRVALHVRHCNAGRRGEKAALAAATSEPFRNRLRLRIVDRGAAAPADGVG